MLHYVHDLINDVWAKGAVPKDWVDADIVPIPKKGDLTSCDNWRGVALLDVVGKLCAKIILGRLQLLAEDVLPEEQCGFRRGRSCSDMAFVVRQFIEKCHEHRTRAFLVYIDLRNPYDSIPRAALWSVLSRVGVPEHLVRLIESFHSGMSARVLVDGIGLEDIAVNNGLRQGCCMAPVLFNIYACAVFERWSSRIEDYGDVGLTLRFKLDKKLFRRASVCGAPLSVSNGQFADDAGMFSSTRVGAERMLQCFADVATDFGLSVSTTKTKFQVVGHDVTRADRTSANGLLRLPVQLVFF